MYRLLRTELGLQLGGAFGRKILSLSTAAAASTAAAGKSSLTISFLKNSCGLSAAAAASIAQRLRFRTTDKPLLILALLRDFGFSDADIARLVTRYPNILNAKPDKTVRPKLEFYRSMGLAGAELSKILSSSPWSLLWSLEKRLIPSFDILKSFLHTNENVIATLKNTPYLLLVDLKKVLPPKIEALRAYGATEPVVELLLKNFAKAFIPRVGRFEEAFAAVKEMGLSPKRSLFAKALGVFGEIPKELWAKKLDNFRRFGWSDDQILIAFARHPLCMCLSEQKVRKNMEFLLEKVKYEVGYISRNPVLLSLGLEKRIIPRFMVLQVLESKDLLKRKIVANCFMISEENFIRNYVMKYQYEAPEVLDAIKGSNMGAEISSKTEKDST